MPRLNDAGRFMIQAENILIIRPSALGDVCRTVPVLASLRRAFPGAAIDWIVQEEFIPAVAAHPDLTAAVAFPRSRLAAWWKNPRSLLEALRWLGAIRRRKYDLVLDCQGLSRSGLMALASRAKVRAGLRRSREMAWLAYNRRVDDGEAIHTVDRMLRLVEDLGIEPVRDMRLHVSAHDRAWWESAQAALSVEPGRYAVLAPTARWLSKRWPIERFAQMIEPLHDRGFRRVVVIGSPGETEQVREIFRRYPPCRLDSDRALIEKSFVVDLVGGTTIGRTMAVIAGAGLVIANDSAPLHMAVGFERPVVALFGPTDPKTVGPYGMDESVIRGYQPRPGETINFKDPRLGDRLMRFISTTAVIQRIDRVMASPAPVRAAPRMSPIVEVRPASSEAAKEDFGRGVVGGAPS